MRWGRASVDSDANLNAYGVRGFKIADLPAAPGNVSANTYRTPLVIGEKVAETTAEELGIKGRLGGTECGRPHYGPVSHLGWD